MITIKNKYEIGDEVYRISCCQIEKDIVIGVMGSINEKGEKEVSYLLKSLPHIILEEYDLSTTIKELVRKERHRSLAYVGTLIKEYRARNKQVVK